MTSTTNKPYVLKATIATRSLPIDLFGAGTSRHQRKLVLNYIATYANPDGTSACPSLQTIADDNGLSRSGAIGIIQWLVDHHLLAKSEQRSKFNTNDYTLLISSEDQEKCRESLHQDAEEQKLLGKAAKKREGRARGGRNAAAKRKAACELLKENLNGSPIEQLPAGSPKSDQGGCSGAQMVAQEHVDGRSMQRHDRPSLPSVKPSVTVHPTVPKTDGGVDGFPAQPRTIKDTANELTEWMSDALLEHADVRFIPSVEDQRRMEQVLGDRDAAIVAGSIYKFLARPRGFGGLADPFGRFWQEISTHIKDAELSAEQEGSVINFLDDLHTDIFPAYARELGRQTPSSRLFDRLLLIIGVERPTQANAVGAQSMETIQ